MKKKKKHSIDYYVPFEVFFSSVHRILPLQRAFSFNNDSESTESSVLSHQRELNPNFDKAKAIVESLTCGSVSVTHLSR